MNMAIEIVGFPIKKCWIHRYVDIYVHVWRPSLGISLPTKQHFTSVSSESLQVAVDGRLQQTVELQLATAFGHHRKGLQVCSVPDLATGRPGIRPGEAARAVRP